jgi:signal transduction histidine kinase
MKTLPSLNAISADRRLGLMLLMLHGAIAFGLSSTWARGFLLLHFVAFLYWQPLLTNFKTINLHTVTLSIICAGLLIFPGWWPIAGWIAALIGLIGANATSMRSSRQNWAHTLGLIYLLTVLLAWVMLQISHTDTPPSLLLNAMRYGLLALPLAILLIRPDNNASGSLSAIDLFYGLMLFLLVLVLILGSFTVVAATGLPYLQALMISLFTLASILVLLSWLWNPHAGFSGLGQILSRYLLTVGLPFEQWIAQLAKFADQETDPHQFIRQSVSYLATLPWLSGIGWRTDKQHGLIGTSTAHQFSYTHHQLSLDWYTPRPLSTALSIHARLLAELLGYFYEAKLREQELRNHAYSQYVHETGARLTHDVKNLLQSMNTLVSAAQSSHPDQTDALLALLQRQLPQITQRLQSTLDKLQAPHNDEPQAIHAAIWWQHLTERHSHVAVKFFPPLIIYNCELPQELFDSVADNLIANALRKQQQDEAVEISVYFACAEQITLSVCDSGAAVPESVTRHLFEAPINSSRGLGIGLYQAAKQAQQNGYSLKLANNEAGAICFTLDSI